MSTLFCSLAILLFWKTLSSIAVNVYSSCDSLIDGLHYIQPLDNNQVIPVICSNGYALIDPSLNFQAITSYLSSYDYSRMTSNIFSSELNDFVNWRQWWLPSNDNTLFTVAPQCTECLSANTSNNAYYESNHYFCFKTLPNNECNTDLNDPSLNIYCNQCDDTQNDQTNWSNCYGIRMSADHIIETDHSKCVSQTIMARPSMVKDRSFCTCYKQTDSLPNIQYRITTNNLPKVHLPLNMRHTLSFIDPNIIFANEDTNNGDYANIYYLTNNDFLYGTYRITNPGKYILTEDILLNFNAPTLTQKEDINFSPNNYDNTELFWWPNTQQMQNGQYTGMYSFHGLYTLGFFAGLTIECDHVIIDLNQYSIAMSKEFHLQQRFFSIIELSNRNFIAAQGPAHLGTEQELYASNVVIQNGKLGLTSHHSIHGNNNRGIIIQNVIISDFDVGGIGLNAGNDIQIIDCVIGPSNDNIPVLGRYTHARALLPRLKRFIDDFGDETVQFYNREVITVSELANTLVKQMDLVYSYVINGEIPKDISDKDWIAAQKLFLNSNGYMDAGSTYGIVLNGEGSATLSIGARIANTADIRIENVEIFGIYNSAVEKVKTVTVNDNNGAIRGMFSEVMDWTQILNESWDMYIGDAYSDIVFAMNKIQMETEWYYLHCMRMTEAIMQFVFDGSVLEESVIDFQCNTDIQMHSIKGAIGLRIDGVQSIDLKNIYISNVSNYGALGSDVCGEYEISEISMEDREIQSGYTGNNAQGLIIDYGKGTFEDILIENIESHFGSSYGMNICKESEVVLKGNIELRNVHSGSKLGIGEIQSMKLPNIIPKSCSIQVSDQADVVYDTEVNIIGDGIIGYDLCDESTQIGQCNDCYIWNDDTVVSNSKDSSIVVMLLAFMIVLALKIGCVRMIKMDGYLKSDISEEVTPLLI